MTVGLLMAVEALPIATVSLLVAIVVMGIVFLRNRVRTYKARDDVREHSERVLCDENENKVKREIERLEQRYIAYLVGEEMIRCNARMAKREAFWGQYPREDAEPICDIEAIARSTGIDLISVNRYCVKWIENCGCEVRGSANIALENAIKVVVGPKVVKLIADLI